MANSLPKKKYKLFKIIFAIFFLAAVCVTFPGFSIDQKRKPEAFAAHILAFWNGRAAPETKIYTPVPPPATGASHPFQNVFMPDKNIKVRLSLKNCNIDYGRIYADDQVRSASLFSLNVIDSNDNSDCIRTEGRLQKDASFCFLGPMKG